MARYLALLLCLVTVSVDGQNENAGMTLLASEVRSGQYEQAVALADDLLKSAPGDARILTLKAIALTRLGRQDAADSFFASALTANPDYIPALAGASELEYKTGSDMALRHVERLLTLRPADETAHAMRAVIAWKRRDCATAAQHFAAARDAIANQPAALRQFGICLALTNRPADSIEPFRRILFLEPGDRRATLDLAEALAMASEAYENLGDTPRAVSSLREAIILTPTREGFYLNFASLCFEHKAFSVGADMISAGISQLPRSAKLYLARGVLYAQMAEYAKADADFQSAQTLNPVDSSGPGAKALAFLQAGSLDEALATVRTSLAAHPADPYLYYLLAEVLVKKGAAPGSASYSEAMAAARKAVQLQPSSNLARDVLSRLYLAAGNLHGAVEQSRLALANDPSDQMALYRLIRALNATGSPSRTEIAELTQRLAQVRRAEEAREQQAGRFRFEETEK